MGNSRSIHGNFLAALSLWEDRFRYTQEIVPLCVGDSHFTKGKVASVTSTISLLFLCVSKVIPLSQRSGIVEWCEDTVPLGEYLIGRPGTKAGAHSRYYPGDWTSLDCRKKVKVN